MWPGLCSPMFKREKHTMYSITIINDGHFRKCMGWNAMSFRTSIIVTTNSRLILSQGQDILYNLDFFPKHLHRSVSHHLTRMKQLNVLSVLYITENVLWLLHHSRLFCFCTCCKGLSTNREFKIINFLNSCDSTLFEMCFWDGNKFEVNTNKIIVMFKHSNTDAGFTRRFFYILCCRTWLHLWSGNIRKALSVWIFCR